MATPGYPIPVDPADQKVVRRRNAVSRPRRSYLADGDRPVERRSNQRFELPLEFDLFQLRGAKRLAWHSAGTTVDWSRNSILLRSGRNLAVGSSAQLVVRWTAGVQLIVVGRVVQSDDRGMVLKILRRRFRGKPMLIVPLSELIGWTQAERAN